MMCKWTLYIDQFYEILKIWISTIEMYRISQVFVYIVYLDATIVLQCIKSQDNLFFPIYLSLIAKKKNRVRMSGEMGFNVILCCERLWVIVMSVFFGFFCVCVFVITWKVITRLCETSNCFEGNRIIFPIVNLYIILTLIVHDYAKTRFSWRWNSMENVTKNDEYIHFRAVNINFRCYNAADEFRTFLLPFELKNN
jgi:hypothetical protein